MSKLDIHTWVDAEAEPGRREFRQAVHLILRAIAQSEELAPIMVMKGGILLAIRYNSSRFTRDVDFSTRQKLQDVDVAKFIDQAKQALELVSLDNDYGLAMTLQSHTLNPKIGQSLRDTANADWLRQSRSVQSAEKIECWTVLQNCPDRLQLQ
jgi:predicted nucleotidyltransferase component of viral defense system